MSESSAPFPPSACLSCGHTTFYTLNTYKNLWHGCAGCGMIYRERKQRYLFEGLIPASLAQRFRPLFYLLRNEGAVETDTKKSDLYDYDNVFLSKRLVEKYTVLTRTYMDRFRELGFNFAGKDVLDISGGPGFIAKSIGDTAQRIAITEYSEVAVERAKSELGIEAYVYDYNADCLNDAITGTFDFILVRYSVNFCKDLPRFCRELKASLKPGGIVYIEFVAPTLGTCLRWHTDDFTYHILYPPAVMHAAFAKEGFELIKQFRDPEYYCTHQRTIWHKLSMLPYLPWNYLKHPLNRLLTQQNRVHVYRKPD